MIRGFSLVKKARSRKDSLPLVASASATVYILTRDDHSQSGPATWKEYGILTAVRIPKCDRIIHVQSRVVSCVAIV